MRFFCLRYSDIWRSATLRDLLHAFLVILPNDQAPPPSRSAAAAICLLAAVYLCESCWRHTDRLRNDSYHRSVRYAYLTHGHNALRNVSRAALEREPMGALALLMTSESIPVPPPRPDPATL